MNRILLAGFSGETNAAKILVDKCSPQLDKLYLENDFSACAMQIQHAVKSDYDFIFMLGQKPVIKSVYIEIVGRHSEECLPTGFDYRQLAKYLTASGYRVHISDNAGNYLCNHAYYYGLKAAQSRGKKTDLVFVHVPVLKNIVDVDHMADVLSAFMLKKR